MEEPKRLYVVSSPHFTRNGEINVDLELLDVIQARIRAIVVIAWTTRFGCYFSDGLTPFLTGKLNRCLDKRSLNEIEIFASNAMNNGRDGYRLWEFLTLAYWFKKGADEDLTFYRFRQTECDNYQKQTRRLRRQIIGRDRKAFRARFASEKAMKEHVSCEETRLRDEHFVKTIQGNGGEENILYVGYRHQLETLPSSLLEWYRLEVDYDSRSRGKVIAVTGNIPRRFKENLEKCVAKDPTKFGKTIDLDVNFV